MFIVRNTIKRPSGKVYHSVLLRKSYREGNKVKKKTIANLSSCSEDEISLLQAFLKQKKDGVNLIENQRFRLLQGKSIGGVYVLYALAKRLGIVDALGSGFDAQLALWLVIARILEQGSRLSATRLDSHYDIASVVGLTRGFDENNLYDCLKWLSKNQQEIEDSLFNRKEHSTKFYWYDVTSSYLEGKTNELAAFGYNRDKKTRKRIIVVGLLCEKNGDPISIEAFKGNTQDTQTIESQILKLKNRFQCRSIAIVGDRGLIRCKQKTLIKKHGLHYISALTLPEVNSLINNEFIRLQDFTQDLKSFKKDEIRYIYRRNKERALETQKQRQERFETAQRKVNQENKRLKERHKASALIAKKRIKKILKKLCLFEWVSVNVVKRQLVLKIDEERLKKKSEMDGCYIWTTDLSEDEASDREVYERYKDLKYVEDDFRTLKTSFLDVRPLYVRTKESTKGHLLVTMLAHMIVKELRSLWTEFNKTVYEALDELSMLCRNYIVFSNGHRVDCIPESTQSMEELLRAANVTMPNHLEEIKVPVVTRHKIRKFASK
jgi:transposase